MALAPGGRFGPYEILSAIGAGGMGEVYRARDPRLERDVAIKVLPEAFAADAPRVARFQREAKLLAALNHPHITQVYGLEQHDGVHALAMELVAGEDLAERLARGALPLDEALAVARQVALGLEAAHERGITHRDLKPANIKLRPDGTVKLLDFGLAMLSLSDAADSPSLSESPTVASPVVTASGIILGTAPYMSPEQARGKPLDRRTDVWAFGCVLYEMLTGRRAFGADDVSGVLAAVLVTEPDFTALPAATPASIRRLLRRCLHKDPGERLRDMGDARLEIRDAQSAADFDEPDAATPGPDRGASRRAWIAVLAVSALALLVSSLVALRPSPARSEMRLDIATAPSAVPLSLAISPDGRTLAYVASSENRSLLWLRSLETGSTRILAGTDGANCPFWSPDSRSLAFFASETLRRVDVDGGSVQSLAHGSSGCGGTWNGDDVILFAPLGSPITRIPAGGGAREALPHLVQQGSDFSPQFLPDGRRFLYYVRGTPEVRGVYIGGLGEAREARRLVESDSGAVFAPSGKLLFVRQGTLFAQDFDPVRLELRGAPFAVADDVATNPDQSGVSVSGTGVIVFRARSAGARRQLVWFDRAGREAGRVGEPTNNTFSNASLSPDGQRVVFYRNADGNTDVWLLETKRGTYSRFTTHVADDVLPIWSPDGASVIFSSNRSGVHDLYRKSAQGGGEETLLLASQQPKLATDVSRDGRVLLFNSRDPKRGVDIWALPLDHPAAPFPVVQTDFDEQNGQLSLDGRFVAYQSNESGRTEVYVQPFPGPGSRVAVSTSGGSHVRWRPDGKELFYLTADGRLTAVSVRAAADRQALEIGLAEPLFTPPLGGALQQGDFRQQYMVSPDGRQFLVPAVVSEEAVAPVRVILNWKPRP